MHNTVPTDEKSVIEFHTAKESGASHSIWLTAIRFTIVTALIVGLGYPLLLTGLAGSCFRIRQREA